MSNNGEREREKKLEPFFCQFLINIFQSESHTSNQYTNFFFVSKIQNVITFVHQKKMSSQQSFSHSLTSSAGGKSIRWRFLDDKFLINPSLYFLYKLWLVITKLSFKNFRQDESRESQKNQTSAQTRLDRYIGTY